MEKSSNYIEVLRKHNKSHLNVNIGAMDNSESSQWEWIDNDGSEDSEWENFDLDWLSKSERTANLPQTTTEKSLHPTQIYEQSVSILIEMKTNITERRLEAPVDRALEVGPWKVTQEQIPYVLGSIIGACLLVLMTVSLSVYLCLRKKLPIKQYNVPSDGSSERSDKSFHQLPTSASRDSLILTTNASLGHQTQLLSDHNGTKNLVLDRSFDFYFHGPISESVPNNNLHDKVQTNSCANAGNHNQEHVNKIYPETEEDNKIMKETKEDYGDTHQSDHNRWGIVAASTQNNKSNEKALLIDDCCKYHSLPIWARSKSLVKNQMSTSFHEKQNEIPPKRRRRMGSDAAQIIALSKSTVKLFDSKSFYAECNSNSGPYNASIYDSAIVIYNERTAL